MIILNRGLIREAPRKRKYIYHANANKYYPSGIFNLIALVTNNVALTGNKPRTNKI